MSNPPSPISQKREEDSSTSSDEEDYFSETQPPGRLTGFLDEEEIARINELPEAERPPLTYWGSSQYSEEQDINVGLSFPSSPSNSVGDDENLDEEVKIARAADEANSEETASEASKQTALSHHHNVISSTASIRQRKQKEPEAEPPRGVAIRFQFTSLLPTFGETSGPRRHQHRTGL